MKREVIVLVFSRGLASALQAVSFILLGRSLAAGEFGIVNSVFNMATIIAVAADFGHVTLTGRLWAGGKRAEAWAVLFWNRRLNLVAGVLMSVVALAIGGLNLAPVALGLSALVFGIAVDKHVDTCMSISISAGMSKEAGTSVVIRRGLALASLAAGLAAGIEPALAYGASWLIAGLGGMVHQDRSLRAMHTGQNSHLAFRDMTRLSMSFLIGNVTAQVRGADVPLTSLGGGAVQGGLYSAASRLVQPALLVSAALSAVLLPRAVRGSNSDARRMGAKLTASTLLIAAIGLAITPFSRTLVSALFGSGYTHASTVLAILLVGFPFVALSSPLGSLLQGRGREDIVARNGVIFALVMLVVFPVAALWWGAEGTALAVGVCFAAKSFTLLQILRRAD